MDARQVLSKVSEFESDPAPNLYAFILGILAEQKELGALVAEENGAFTIATKIRGAP